MTSTSTRPWWRGLAAGVRSGFGLVATIIGVAVAFPLLVLLLVRVARPGYAGSPDSDIARWWALADRAGQVVCVLILLAATAMGVWSLLK